MKIGSFSYILILAGICLLLIGVHSALTAKTDVTAMNTTEIKEIRTESLNENKTHLNETIVKTNPVYNPSKTNKSNETTEPDFEEISDSGPTAYELAQQKQDEEDAQKDERETNDISLESESPGNENEEVSEDINEVKNTIKIERKINKYGYFKEKKSFLTTGYYKIESDGDGNLKLGKSNGKKTFIVIPVDS